MSRLLNFCFRPRLIGTDASRNLVRRATPAFRPVTRAVLLTAIFLAATVAQGQVPTGAPPFSSTTSSSFDTVNNANLNVTFAIPILNKAGKGLSFAQALAYNSSVWTPYSAFGQVWTPAANWGWGGIASANPNFTTATWQQGYCMDYIYDDFYWDIWTFYTYYDSSGTAHPIGNGNAGLTLSNWDQSGADCGWGQPPSSANVTLNDGSGYTMLYNLDVDGVMAWVYPPSGNWAQVSIQGDTTGGAVNDPNGNGQGFYASGNTTTFTDTLGLTALTAAALSGSNTYTYTGPKNSQPAYTVKYTAIGVITSFGCSGISEYSGLGYFPTEIDLPDYNVNTNPNERYTFTYEPTPGYGGVYTTGRLASITLPTGQAGGTTISYTYSGGNNNSGIVCADGTTAGLTRTTMDGAWNYTRTENTSTTWSTTVADPLGNQTAFNFVVGANGNAYETERKVYSGSSNLMETVDTCYNTSPTCVTTPVSLPISNQTVQVTLGNLSPAKTYTVYNSNGLPTEVDEYTYGPSLVGQTLTTYASSGNYIYSLPSDVQVKDGQGNLAAHTQYIYDSYGNLHKETRYTSPTASVSRTFTYMTSFPNFGVLQTATDFNGNTTTYNSYACNNAFPTSITTGGLTTTQTWDCNGGVLTSVTDPNNQTTTYTYDNFWRVTGIHYPDAPSGVTSVATSYPNPNEIDTTTALTSSSNRVDKVLLDGLGRVSQKVLESDPAGADTVTTTYDALGRVASVTNPYRSTSDPTYGVTSYNYDPLNRTTSITRPDGDTVGTSYSGNCATSTDEAGKVRTVCTDALGRVASATEDPSGLNYQTTYTNDALNDLTVVNQGGETRNYSYDMLSRLTQSITPEEGTTNYTYPTASSLCSGDPSQVCTRTDARGVTTTYSYSNDGLNLLLSKTYSDGTTPAANFFYSQPPSSWPAWSGVSFSNAQGRMVLACTGSASGTCSSPQTAVAYSYDPVGRAQAYWQCTPANCGNSSIWETVYNYDLAGDVSSWTHPEGFTITNSISGAQRVTEIASSWSDQTHPQYLAQNITYAPHGGVSTLLNGCAGSGCTQTQETYAYNNRLQTSQIELGTTGNPSAYFNLAYNYYLPGGTTPPGCPVSATGSGNNGNVIGYTYTDGVNNSTMSHSALNVYDSLNRLVCAQATGNATYNLQFSYNREPSWSGHYGNMGCVTNQYTNGPCPNWTYNNTYPNTNRNDSFSYNAAGDVTGDESHSYQYDAEGRLAGVDSGATESYTYNTLGQEVRFNASTYTWDHLYDTAGSWIGRWSNNFWPVPGVFHLGGRPFAVYIDQAYSIHVNALGTTTMDANAAGSVVGDMAVYPWGQFWLGGSPEWHYAGFEYGDSATGLYPTLFRQYSNNEGRWLSPDSVRGDVTNPQLLNLYSYVTNNPTTLTDPSGQCGCGGGGGFGFAGGGGGGCGGGRGGAPQPPPTIPIPGTPGISTPGGGFPNPFTLPSDQPPSPWYSIIVWLPFPPWPPMPPQAGGSTAATGGSSTGGLCQGTTSCKYYDDKCKDPSVPNKDYYCGIAPIACRGALNGRTSNCIRLCLQTSDPCLHMASGGGFNKCMAEFHATCFAYCDLACNMPHFPL